MTIPKEVRDSAHLTAGDIISFTVEGDRVTLRKLAPACDYLRSVEATLSEWNSQEDGEAWREL